MDTGRQRSERLALLIDAENIPAKFAAAILAKARTLGVIATVRAYGHFDNEKLKAWHVPEIDSLGIVRISVAQSNTRKNSADFRLAIEAMDMLHSRRFDGLCLASSDGDFSFLAERIRASAMSLYLFGHAKTPADYKALGHVAFIEIESLTTPRKDASAPTDASRAKAAPTQTKSSPPVRAATRKPAKPVPRELEQEIIAAIQTIEGKGQAASTQKISTALSRPGKPFRPGDYDANDMKQLLRRVNGVTLSKGENETVARLTRAKP